MVEVAVTELERKDVPIAVGVLARGMRDNPNHVVAWGDDPLRRLRGSERMFCRMTSALPQITLNTLVARRGAWIVGVCGMAPPGTCRPSPGQMLQMVPTMAMMGPGTARRLMQWLRAWAKRDPVEPHWHLGPVAVEGGLQGMGIGSQMLERFCARMDDEGEVAYLETDKPENVRFYEKFGFVTVGEAEVLGAPNWFMRRGPARR